MTEPDVLGRPGRHSFRHLMPGNVRSHSKCREASQQSQEEDKDTARGDADTCERLRSASKPRRESACAAPPRMCVCVCVCCAEVSHHTTDSLTGAAGTRIERRLLHRPPWQTGERSTHTLAAQKRRDESAAPPSEVRSGSRARAARRSSRAARRPPSSRRSPRRGVLHRPLEAAPPLASRPPTTRSDATRAPTRATTTDDAAARCARGVRTKSERAHPMRHEARGKKRRERKTAHEAGSDMDPDGDIIETTMLHAMRSTVPKRSMQARALGR